MAIALKIMKTYIFCTGWLHQFSKNPKNCC